jgi:hypothetical protein
MQRRSQSELTSCHVHFSTLNGSGRGGSCRKTRRMARFAVDCRPPRSSASRMQFETGGGLQSISDWKNGYMGNVTVALKRRDAVAFLPRVGQDSVGE